MTTTSRLTLGLLAAGIAVNACPLAAAQGDTVQLPAKNSLTSTATSGDEKTKSTYKKATWTAYQTKLKGGSTSREIPPTDCPPLPPKDCLDTWDDELTTAKPSR